MKFHHVPMDNVREEVGKIKLVRQSNHRFCDPLEFLPLRPSQQRRFVPRVDAPMSPVDVPDFYEMLANFEIFDPSNIIF